MRVRARAVMALLLVVAVAGTAAPAVAQDPVPYFVDEEQLPFEPLPGHEGADRRWGVLRGAGYRIEVPADWNGDLVLFAHGYRGTGLELTVSNPALRPHLLERGYAWAASSYATNGYDPGQGALDTAALAHRFAGLVERPARTYVIGTSMGGHVTAAAIERYPFMFDGAMPMCGVLGDLELFDYFLDYNVVAEALSGVEVPFPPPPDYATAYGPRIAVELGSPFPTELDAQGEALKAVTRQISGGDRPGFDQAFEQWATFLLGRGNALSDNVDTVYQLDADPEVSEAEAALNASVARHARPELTAEQIQQYAPLDADIYVPTLSLHTLGDLYVPFSMEQVYARRAVANDTADLLVQRAIRDPGHCGFSLDEQVAAFDDLVRWVEEDVRPEGDAVLDAAAVADPAFGCRFTSPVREGDTGCPPVEEPAPPADPGPADPAPGAPAPAVVTG